MWENIVIQSTGESSSTYFYVKSLMYSYILPMTQNINGSHHQRHEVDEKIDHKSDRLLGFLQYWQAPVIYIKLMYY